MKKEQKERKVFETVYIAMDGTEFQSETECSKYEESAKCVIYAKYYPIVVNRISEDYLCGDVGCPERSVDVLKISSEEDKDIVTQVYAFEHEYKKDDQCVKAFRDRLKMGINFVGTGFEKDWYYLIGTPDEMCERIRSAASEK